MRGEGGPSGKMLMHLLVLETEPGSSFLVHKCFRKTEETKRWDFMGELLFTGA
jgi:hypothetical protein